MNTRLGIERLLVVFWSIIAFVGGGFAVYGFFDYYGEEFEVISGLLIALFSFPAWKVSIWVLDGFIPRENGGSQNLSTTEDLVTSKIELPINKKLEYLKVVGAALIVLIIGGTITSYSELVGAIVLYAGLIAALRMAVIVYRGGRAFD